MQFAGPRAATIQVRFNTDLTATDYVKTRGWQKASQPECPFHPDRGCKLVGHGTYARKTPDGARVRRYRCRKSGTTVSMLPDCLAANQTGTLDEWEREAGVAAKAATLQAGADKLLPGVHIKPAGAQRWVSRRRWRIRFILQTLVTLSPNRFGGLEPHLEAFSGALGSDTVPVRLRAEAASRLHKLPAPLGFLRFRNTSPSRAPPIRQHATGLDPPPGDP